MTFHTVSITVAVIFTIVWLPLYNVERRQNVLKHLNPDLQHLASEDHFDLAAPSLFGPDVAKMAKESADATSALTQARPRPRPQTFLVSWVPLVTGVRDALQHGTRGSSHIPNTTPNPISKRVGVFRLGENNPRTSPLLSRPNPSRQLPGYDGSISHGYKTSSHNPTIPGPSRPGFPHNLLWLLRPSRRYTPRSLRVRPYNPSKVRGDGNTASGKSGHPIKHMEWNVVQSYRIVFQQLLHNQRPESSHYSHQENQCALRWRSES